MFRRVRGVPEFLLVHPGGPFFAGKDEGSWTIPKGEVQPGEELIIRARIEFAEELGFSPHGDLCSLGAIKQKGGKTVFGWGVEGDLPEDFMLKSNSFELEWPPHSDRWQTFPEVDRAEFFSESVARQRINSAQIEFLDRLKTILARC